MGIRNSAYPDKKEVEFSKLYCTLLVMEFTPNTLPTNLEAEQAVLAAVLLNNRALERISDFLRADHFTHPAHKEMYKLAERQFASGIPFDIITAKNYLNQQGALDTVGGEDYLSQLFSMGSSIVNVDQYARIVYENALRRELIDLGQNIARDAYVEDLDNTVTHQIESAEQRLFNLATEGTVEKGAVDIGTAFKSALTEAEIAYKADGSLSGLTTGFEALDKSISGLHHSDLIIIAGRPAMGKTALSLNLAFNSAYAIHKGRANKQYKGVVIFFSLEMSAAQLASRVLSAQAEVPASTIRNGSLTDEQFLKMNQTADALSGVPLHFDDTPAMSVPMMRTRARRLARKHGGVAMIVVDYIQLMTSPGGRKSENRVQELSEITRGLKMLAKELDAPVIALSQLSRSVEQRDDKRPLLSDLRESGSIEQDADLVMFTYREEYYLAGRDPSDRLSGHKLEDRAANWAKRLADAAGKAEVIVAKNRHGAPGTVKLGFKGDYTLFHDLPNEYMPPAPGNSFVQNSQPSAPQTDDQPEMIDADLVPDMAL